jgi:5'-nucleotidase
MEYCFRQISSRKGYHVSSVTWFSCFKVYCDLHWQDYASKKLTKREYRRLRYINTMKDFNIKVCEQEADCLQDYFSKVVSQFVVPIDGMNNLLSQLKNGQQCKLGIITNGNSLVQLEKIKALHLDKLIPPQLIFISDQIKVAKPNPLIFKIAKERCGSNQDKCIYIGDSLELDIISAKKAGWDAIHFNTRNEPTRAGSRTPVCETVDELAAYLFT